MYSDIVGAIVIVLSAILAVETRNRWLKGALWGVFILAVVAQVTFQRRDRKQQVATAQVAATDAKKDKDDVMALLKNGQEVLSNVLGEMRDIRSKLGAPSSSKSDDALLARAGSAEQAARTLQTLYTWEIKKSQWPYGAAGANYPGLHEFFNKNFPEATDLNGEDRFFLYYLMKHNCEIDWVSVHDDMKNLTTLFYKEFAPAGAPAQMALDRLVRLGFVEKNARKDDIARLKEPYCSRFKSLPVP